MPRMMLSDFLKREVNESMCSELLQLISRRRFTATISSYSFNIHELELRFCDDSVFLSTIFAGESEEYKTSMSYFERVLLKRSNQLARRNGLPNES
jgi:hypothetical protein